MLSYQEVDVARYKRALEIIKREKRGLRGKGIILDSRNENFSFITDFINKIENFLKLIEDAQNIKEPQYINEETFSNLVEALFRFRDCNIELYLHTSCFAPISGFSFDGASVRCWLRDIEELLYRLTSDYNEEKFCFDNPVTRFVSGETKVPKKLWRELKYEEKL